MALKLEVTPMLCWETSENVIARASISVNAQLHVISISDTMTIDALVTPSL